MVNQYVQIASGILLGISVLVIIYAGFKYATSQGDPRGTEQAKLQILIGGLGIFISMIGTIIGSVLSKASSSPVHSVHSDKDGTFALLSLLLGVFIVIPLINFITRVIVKRKDKKTAVPRISPKPSLTLEKKEAIDESMQTFFSSIFSTIGSLEKELTKGDIEQKHILHNLKQDTERLLHSFTNLSKEKKISYDQKVMERLQKIEHTLQVLQENLETNNILQVEKILLLIDERYQHEKSH